jgi:uncharacterized protein YegP (UPF0339 family)
MRFVIRKNSQGKFWWRAVAVNNEILAASELMNSKQSCENGIRVVMEGAGSAEVVDMTHETKEREAV